ncbi:MAG: hypothetical protein WKF88_08120 [Ferruginibacter sp.]
MKMLLLLLSLFAATFFSSCKSEENINEDLTNTVNKNGSVETAVTVQHLNDSNDILMTTHTVWHLGNEYKKFSYADTVPSLGKETTRVENAAGESVPVERKKDYEIFITVK